MLDTQTIGARIRAALKIGGINQSKLAKITGVTAQAVGQWIKNSRVDKRHLPVIAKATGVRVEWLLSGEGPALSSEVSELINTDYELEQGSKPPLGTIPLLAWNEVPSTTDEERFESELSTLRVKRWVACTRPHGISTFALKVTGHSMTALAGLSVPEGYLIVVDPEQRQVQEGDLVLALIKEQITFKQLATEDGRQYLRPLNPQHPPVFDTFHILGKIIQVFLDI